MGYVKALNTVTPQHLQGVRVVVIGCAPWKFINRFRADSGFQYDLYSDPQRQLYLKLGFIHKLGGLGDKKSPHVENSVSGILQSTWRGLKSMALQGDILQQGGALVLGPGNVVHYAHMDENPADHAPIDDLLKAAGLPPWFQGKYDAEAGAGGAAAAAGSAGSAAAAQPTTV